MDTVTLHGKSFEPFISAGALEGHIAKLAERMAKDYQGRCPLFVGVLNGSYFFTSELVKRLPIECEVTFMRVASYQGTESTGTVTRLLGLSEGVRGRHVVVVEDIVDTGNTIAHIAEAMRGQGPASMAIATMLLKPEVYKKDLPVDYVALEIPNAFVVGSGLDHDGLGRNLPGIYRIVNH